MLFVLSACLLFWAALSPDVAAASPQQAYEQAMRLASVGRTKQAMATLEGAMAVLPRSDPWYARVAAADALLFMRQQHLPTPGLQSQSDLEMALARRFVDSNPAPSSKRVWPAVLFAVILPGAGHAWLGRWHDASVAALMVWPMLLLTVWAAFRRMGPVTVFFALVTLWLWSGTVFSAMSLAERGNAEAYMAWWQHVWQSSGLPGHPW